MTAALDGLTTEHLSSPFAGPFPAAGEAAAAPAAPAAVAAPPVLAAESPFAGLTAEGPGRDDTAEADLLEALYDEDFTDALAALVDEAAARHLADQSAWSGRLTEGEALSELEEWVEPLALAAEHGVERMGQALATTRPETMGDAALQRFLEDAAETPPLDSEAFDHFLGGFLKKAASVVGGAVKAVGKAVGKVLPIGAVLKKLGGVVRPLLKKMLGLVLGKLPAAVRPIARSLAAKLGIKEAEAQPDAVAALAEAFDRELVTLVTRPDAVPGEALEDESWETELWRESPDPVGELDAARVRLAQQLTTLPPGASASPPIQQFLPALAAVWPVVKLAITFIGRDKVVKFLADRIADLVKGLIGAEAAKLVVPPLVDLGMGAIGLEAEAEADATGVPAREALAGEALVSTVEGTVHGALQLLPADSFGDELALDAAVQAAFAEAAAAYLPDRLLQRTLAERETAEDGGMWVLMPRGVRPRRYRRYTEERTVPVTRQVARAIRWTDGGTLETRLLDRGLRSWPVLVQVRLYEAVPGTHLGHLARGEAGEDGEHVDAAEFQPLTPEVAGLLLHEPALGKPAAPVGGRPTPVGGAVRPRPLPGRRLYRVRVVGPGAARVARVRTLRRVLLSLDPTRGKLEVSIRLSERQAHELLARIRPTDPSKPRDLAGVLTAVRAVYAPLLSGALADRLVSRGLVPDATAARGVGERVTEAVTSAISAHLGQHAAAVATAVQDPAAGITIRVGFSGATREGLLRPLTAGQVDVTAGWRVRA
ncbi:hypothetical protein SAMN05660464_3506 [Geodermatophilus dictyosporus]|uniref:Uncharacterized protein n=1 Tax=Geodermatophilus dictyosporus TaxID=1523247 RepID=A0A1I5R7Q4_9ACTN|nr:hypothetical protein [Geodermatophilus dictyosporus]SFP54046.1 hypothetical protein SAMN05660464_3506 [Geodermatophilus dictyosporus]